MPEQVFRVAWFNSAGRRVRTTPVFTNLRAAKTAREHAQARSRARITVETRIGTDDWEPYE